MGTINTSRWLLGGFAAAVVIWLIEGAASVAYMGDMEAAMKAHNLSMEMTAATWIISILVSLVAGLVSVFFYAAARPRLGPGPKTAVTVAVVFWMGSYLLSLMGYYMVGLYPVGLLVMWGAIGLAELIVATLVGAWLYRET